MEIKYIHREDIHNLKAPKAIVPIIMNQFKPKSVIDIGCGIGTWLSVFSDYGVQIKGVDGNYVDKSLFHIREEDFHYADLEKDKLDHLGKYDIVINLEVAEHLNEVSSDLHVANLCSLSDVIIFSAALPGQGGQNHINEQWLYYWTAKFNSKGYILKDIFRKNIWNDENIDWWYRQNIVVFQKNINGDSNDPVCSLIHPELFKNKLNEISQLESLIKSPKKLFIALIRAIIK
jgi:SAM-dependent methyltransferase